MRYIFLITAFVALVAIVGACSSTAAGSPSPTGTPTATTPAGTGRTFGQSANDGRNVFTARCAMCHGNQGQGVIGPAIIGSNANLQKYNTAKGILDFISIAMPQNSPGSLPHQNYLDVLSYLLVQNNFVSSGTTFDERQLTGIQLNR